MKWMSLFTVGIFHFPHKIGNVYLILKYLMKCPIMKCHQEELQRNQLDNPVRQQAILNQSYVSRLLYKLSTKIMKNFNEIKFFFENSIQLRSSFLLIFQAENDKISIGIRQCYSMMHENITFF